MDLSPALDEITSDENAWFSSPWRDGRNAVRLLETLGILGGGHALPPPLQSALVIAPDQATSHDYAAVEQAGLDAALTLGVDGVVWPAAAACLANWIAKSHGGGHVPNVHLRAVTGWLLWRGLAGDHARWEVGRARAVDLGLDTSRATEFTRLWFRRRYQAAWRLGRE